MLPNVETPWLTARPPMLCTRHARAVVLITCTPVDASAILVATEAPNSWAREDTIYLTGQR